jgi:hypothetical protein
LFKSNKPESPVFLKIFRAARWAAALAASRSLAFRRPKNLLRKG